ncbi:MAG: 5-oxoprolinase subunit PxpA [Symbiobacteriaceae bacterium]|nr:5-oxoprolinase subunit PxpA [Symbiobacteriaceae bacterium]
MLSKQIDLNCDMGEAFGVYSYGADEEIITSISSANIACGWHAGDPLVMQARVQLCLRHGVAIGAHPGFPDLLGFGRRNMVCTPAEYKAYTLYQVGALYALARSQGGELSHVKAHGNFYNMAAVDNQLARAIAEAVYEFDPKLVFVGLAGSQLCRAGVEVGLKVASEVFGDRAYRSDGTLLPRSEAGAVYHEVAQVVAQIMQIVETGTITAVDGTVFPVVGDTLCLHGDTPGAALFAREVRSALTSRGVAIRAMAS